MSCAEEDCARRDLVGGWSALVLWGIPTVLILLGVFVPVVRAALWIPSFAVMGVSCLASGRRCRRLHCHATGPLFLAAALATALDALAIVAVPWAAILTVAAVGTALAFGMEWMRGRYARGVAPSLSTASTGLDSTMRASVGGAELDDGGPRPRALTPGAGRRR